MRVRSVGAYGDGHDRDGGVSEGGVAHVVAQAEAHGVNGEPERASAHTHWQGGQHSAQDGHFGRLGRVWFVLLVGGIAPEINCYFPPGSSVTNADPNDVVV